VRATLRDATYVLDGILDNHTELPIAKHTTDTARYSDVLFGLFDLLDLDFCPHLAGLHALHDFLFYGNDGKIRLATLDRQSTPAACLHLVANAIVAWDLIAAERALNQLEAEDRPAARELRRQFSPTLNAHANKIGRFDINPDRGCLITEPAERDDAGRAENFH
jgi:TnpA family transposase